MSKFRSLNKIQTFLSSPLTERHASSSRMKRRKEEARPIKTAKSALPKQEVQRSSHPRTLTKRAVLLEKDSRALSREKKTQ